MQFAGVHLSDDDCRTVIDLLLRVGRADDLELVRRIQASLDARKRRFTFSAAERELLLSVLDDPPPGGLSELREVLVLETFG
jgi:hypothetical protein